MGKYEGLPTTMWVPLEMDLPPKFLVKPVNKTKALLTAWQQPPKRPFARDTQLSQNSIPGPQKLWNDKCLLLQTAKIREIRDHV